MTTFAIGTGFHGSVVPRLAPATPPPTVRPPAAATVDSVEPPPPAIPTSMGRAPEAFGRDYWQALEGIAGVLPEAATRSEVLRDNQTAFQRRMDLINNAEHSIIFNTYFFHPDEYSVRMVDALLAAQRRGVQVMLCLDDFAESMAGFTYPSEFRDYIAGRLRELEAAGGFVSWYAAPAQQLNESWGSGNHFKALVVDERTAIVGGRNIGRQYFGEHEERWSDFEMLLEGPIASRIGFTAMDTQAHGDVMLRRADHDPGASNRYKNAWDREIEALSAAIREQQAQVRAQTMTHAKPNSYFQLVSWDPTFGDGTKPGVDPSDNAVTRALIETLRRAQHRVVISTNYLNGDRDLLQALGDAAQRGVDVHVVVTGEAASEGMAAPIYAGMIEGYVPALHAAGVHIHETTRQEHGKMVVVDDAVAAFGSYNWETCSDGALAEGMLFTRDPDTIAAINAALTDTIEHRTTEYTGPRDRGFWDTMGHFFMTLFGWAIRPVL